MSLFKSFTYALIVLVMLSLLIAPSKTYGVDEWRYYVKQKMVTDLLYGVSRYGAPRGQFDIMYDYHLNGELYENLYFENNTFTIYTIYNCTGGWLRTYGRENSLNKVEPITPGQKSCIKHESKESLKDFNSYIRSLFTVYERFNKTVKAYLPRDFKEEKLEFSMKYGGLKIYNGVFVNVFRVNFVFTGSSNSSGDINGYFYGTVYVYAGLPHTVYRNMTFYIEEETLAGKIVYRYRETAETVEHNLPREIQYGYKKIGESMEIIVGGLPGSKIYVNGERGSSEIKAVNRGDNVGFIMISYSGGKNSSYTIYGLGPGSERKIKLRQVLDEDIDLQSTAKVYSALSLEEALPIIIMGVVSSAVVIVVIYSSRRFHAKSS